jgi:hypothetical protein
MIRLRVLQLVSCSSRIITLWTESATAQSSRSASDELNGTASGRQPRGRKIAVRDSSLILVDTEDLHSTVIVGDRTPALQTCACMRKHSRA